jgi:hypothetical protein
MIYMAILRKTKYKIMCYLDNARAADFSAKAFFNSVGWSWIKYGKYFSGKMDKEHKHKSVFILWNSWWLFIIFVKNSELIAFLNDH